MLPPNEDHLRQLIFGGAIRVFFEDALDSERHFGCREFGFSTALWNASTKALRLNHDSIPGPHYGAMFQISDQGQIQKDSSHLRATAIDAVGEATEIQRFAKIVCGVAEKTHERHVTLNQAERCRTIANYAKTKGSREGTFRMFSALDRCELRP